MGKENQQMSTITRVALLLLALLALTPAAHAQPYIGVEINVAKFDRVGESSRSISSRLNAEGISSSQQDRTTDLSVSPVIGYRGPYNLGIELGLRSFEWTSRVNASSGATTLTDAAATSVSSVRFTSIANTTAEGFTVGLTFTPPLGGNAELFVKVGLAYLDICSHVFEESDAHGRTPHHVEGRSGFCRSDGFPNKSRFHESHKLVALGYTRRFWRSWSATAYIEAIGDVGSQGTVFVDGGGVGNQTLYSTGLRLTRHFQ
jgi:hypothetical protein